MKVNVTVLLICEPEKRHYYGPDGFCGPPEPIYDWRTCTCSAGGCCSLGFLGQKRDWEYAWESGYEPYKRRHPSVVGEMTYLDEFGYISKETRYKKRVSYTWDNSGILKIVSQ